MKKLYCIAVLLPDSLEELILQLKREIAGRFNTVAALKPTCQITMQDTFLYDDKNLSRLTTRLNETFCESAPFDVELQNFGAFPAHTIFAAVRNFAPFQKLREMLFWKLRAEGSLSDAAIGSRQITPHVTVAYRDLSEEKFAQAWIDFSQRELSASFVAASAHLMEHRGKWRSVREFPFSGQADLFCA